LFQLPSDLATICRRRVTKPAGPGIKLHVELPSGFSDFPKIKTGNTT
jgi:hypothetical protein